MAAKITTLIDKQDNFEIVRDKIAQILADEIANQQVLALAATKDPLLWKLKIYTERSNPWELFLNKQDATVKTPIVNVWFDNSNIDGQASNTVERQKVDGTFNIDIYALGISQTDGGSGHIAGDEDAATEAQRALRLVRNILMAGTYTYLGFPRKENQFVWKRMVQAITSFQPEQTGNQAQQIQAIRLSLAVSYNEFSPQVEGEILDLITNDIKRESDGAIIAEANYEYPQ